MGDRTRLGGAAKFRKFRRSPWQKVSLFIFVLLNFYQVLQIQHSLASEPKDGIQASAQNQKIYIASLHWNTEYILRTSWIAALLDLVNTLGPHNVFVSIFESGSVDNTEMALWQLDQKLGELGISRRIEWVNRTHTDVMNEPAVGPGWIDTPRGKKEKRRIPYLAKLRNRTLRDLEDMHRRGFDFDKVLFLNDVVFKTQDVLTLLDTNGGEYAAACGLDYSKPPLYYDTFAVRDSQGHEHLMQTWPYFRSRASRHAIMANKPVPVRSCMNGISVMPATHFTSSTSLHFRATTDSLALHHVEGSECCLIHADNPDSVSKGVFLNPKVRVGYNIKAYNIVNPSGSWLSTWQILSGLWENRLRRVITSARWYEWIVHRRVKKWKSSNPGEQEPGWFCLVDEMQVLHKIGWEHV